MARSPSRRGLRFVSGRLGGGGFFSGIFAESRTSFDERRHASYDTLAFEAVDSVSCPCGSKLAL